MYIDLDPTWFGDDEVDDDGGAGCSGGVEFVVAVVVAIEVDSTTAAAWLS